MAGQRFVYGIVDYLEHQMVQTSSVRGISNIHAWTFAHRFQPFQDLDRAFAIRFRRACLIGVYGGLEVGTVSRTFTGMDGIQASCRGRCWLVFFCHGWLYGRFLKLLNDQTRMVCGFGEGLLRFWKHQIRIGITTYLKVAFSGMVNKAELFPSESSSLTISWSILLNASIR